MTLSNVVKKVRASLPFLILAGVLFITFWACLKNDTSKPPGNIHAFTPVESFSEIAAYAGKNARIVDIYAQGVLYNGTLDLDAGYRPSVRYDFIVTPSDKDKKKILKKRRPTPPGIVVQPPTNYISVSVCVMGPHWVQTSGSEREGTSYSKGMWRVIGDDFLVDNKKGIDAPKCSFSQLFQAIPNSIAYQNDSANIKYDKDGYTLELNGAKKKFRFNMDGALVESGPSGPWWNTGPKH